MFAADGECECLTDIGRSTHDHAPALFCAHGDANGVAAQYICAPAANLTIAQTAVLLDVEPANLLRMIFDPEVSAEDDWHIVREAGEICLPAWACGTC
jgi:hypothetical protein